MRNPANRRQYSLDFGYGGNGVRRVPVARVVNERPDHRAKHGEETDEKRELRFKEKVDNDKCGQKMQFDFSGQPPGWYVANRVKILAPNVRLQVEQIREPMRPTVLDRRRNHFAEERPASEVRQKKNGGDRKDAARGESQVPRNDEQKDAEVFVVASCAFDCDVGRENSADEKERIDREKSVQKATQRKTVEDFEDVERICCRRKRALALLHRRRKDRNCLQNVK